MESATDLREIEKTLPNGFHDAILQTLTINFNFRRVIVDLRLLVGNPDAENEQERETYRRATLQLNDAVYIAIDGASSQS